MSQQEVADPAQAAEEEGPGELPRSGSSSRLNAQAPEFVPRAAAAPPQAAGAAPPPPPQVIRCSPRRRPPRGVLRRVSSAPPPFEYYPAVGGGGGFGAPVELEAEAEQQPPPGQQSGRDGISDDVVHKITKQVDSPSCCVVPIRLVRLDQGGDWVIF